mgnify:CR=1 FL=1
MADEKKKDAVEKAEKKAKATKADKADKGKQTEKAKYLCARRQGDRPLF